MQFILCKFYVLHKYTCKKPQIWAFFVHNLQNHFQGPFESRQRPFFLSLNSLNYLDISVKFLHYIDRFYGKAESNTDRKIYMRGNKP